MHMHVLRDIVYIGKIQEIQIQVQADTGGAKCEM